MNEIEKKIQELQDLKSATESALKEMKEAAESNVETKSAIDNLDASIKDLSAKIAGLEKQIEIKESELGLYEQAEKILNSNEFKSAAKEVVSKKRQSSGVFEVKISTSDVTNPVQRTNAAVGIFGAMPFANLFLGNAGSPFIIPEGKNRASWVEGSYTSNVGYIDELTAISTADAGSMTEKTREMAKVGARMLYAAEMVEDTSTALNWFKTKAQQYILDKVDNELFAGDGNDTTAPKHIYGIKVSGSTAFNATTAGLNGKIDGANVVDVITAAKTQIKISGKDQYMPNAIFMNPTTATLIKSEKNSQNDAVRRFQDCVVLLPNGQLQIDGLPVYETTKIGATELLVADTNTWQLHQKRALELEVEREASTDSFVLYLRWRGNFVVPTSDKLGNIYVSDIATAKAALETA